MKRRRKMPVQLPEEGVRRTLAGLDAYFESLVSLRKDYLEAIGALDVLAAELRTLRAELAGPLERARG